jgi:hypothetical protein
MYSSFHSPVSAIGQKRSQCSVLTNSFRRDLPFPRTGCNLNCTLNIPQCILRCEGPLGLPRDGTRWTHQQAKYPMLLSSSEICRYRRRQLSPVVTTSEGHPLARVVSKAGSCLTALPNQLYSSSNIGEESKRKGTNALTSQEIDRIIKTTRAQKTKR